MDWVISYRLLLLHLSFYSRFRIHVCRKGDMFFGDVLSKEREMKNKTVGVNETFVFETWEAQQDGLTPDTLVGSQSTTLMRSSTSYAFVMFLRPTSTAPLGRESLMSARRVDCVAISRFFHTDSVRIKFTDKISSPMNYGGLHFVEIVG